VKDTLVERGGEAGGELACDVDSLILGQAADAPQKRAEIFAVDVLHREEVKPRNLTDIVDAADVRMSDLSRDTDLAPKALDSFLVSREFFGEELQGHGLLEREVVSMIDFAHATPPD